MKRKLLFLSVLLVSQFVAIRSEAQVIQFADANVKALCVANWDTNGDGELSIAEAAAVTSLGEVFKRNKSIVSFDELEYFTGLTTIDNAFTLCTGLTSVTIPNSVSIIGYKAFYGCSALRSVGNFYHITAIGNSAFYNCSSLSVLPIGDYVTIIGSYAFYGCTGYMDCPESVTYIGQGAFSSIGYNYNGIHYLGNWILGHNLSISGELIIEDGKRVIAESAFEACDELTSVTIPSSVVGIGSCAFQACNSLHTVVSLIEEPFAIADDVFEAVGVNYSIYTTATLIVPIGTKAKYQATDGWKNFTNIVESSNINFADANVKAICVANWDTNGDGELSFDEAAEVTDIGYAFAHSDITSFDELKFFTGLTSITLTVTDLNGYIYSAFAECSKLTSVVIPNKVTDIGAKAFYGCNSLITITIPPSVTDIQYDAFGGCKSLTSVHITDLAAWCNISFFSSSSNPLNSGSWTHKNQLILNGSELTNVEIPDGVTSIGDYAFYHGTGITSVMK